MKWRLLFVPFALLTVALMRLLSPWLLIRVGELWAPRLGHLIGNTECYLYEKEAGLHPKSLDFWYSGGEACNKVIEAKYRRTLHTWPAWWGHLVVKVNEMFPNHKRHVAESTQFDRDIYNLWTGAHIGFTEAEERKGEKLLKDLGIEGPWCCLIVRDAAYLGDGYGYHAYRDSDVDTYVLAALELVRRGYTVVRMGAKVAKRFHVKHPRIIDYACDGLRTDFADLYLGAKCALTVGTSTGFISIPHIFHRPILFVNHAPLEYLPSYYSNGALIWKHHEKDGKRMTLAEVYASGAGQFTFQHEFDKLGIKVVDNSPQELLEAVEDFLDGNFDESGAFWKDFPLKSRSPYNGAPLHGEVKLKIPRRFGENNSH